MKLLKNEGMSFENIDKCIEICKKMSIKTPQRITEKTADKNRACRLEKLTQKVSQYLNKERIKIPDALTIWHASSDVIESLFGKYKSCKADNPLYGVTPLVLSLCVHTHWDEDNKVRKQDIQNALKSVSMANLGLWKSKYLIENQVVRRKKRSKNERTF